MKRRGGGGGRSKRAKITVIGEDDDGQQFATSRSYGPLAAEAHTERLRRESVQAQSSSRGGRGNAASDNDSAGSPGGTWGASGPPSPASSTFSGLSNGKDVSGELRDAFVRHRQPINVRSLGSTNWGFRRAREVQNWSEQLGPLVDTYLEYRHTAAAAGAPAPTLFEKYLSDAHVLASPVRGHVQLVDISGVCVLPRTELGSEPANIALLRLGYLGSSPTRPSIAFSVRTLLLFERLRARARTGKMNFVRAFCDILNLPYTNSFRNRFADAVDAFGHILRAVDDRVRVSLHRDKLWRMKNACPACSYKCEAEEPLTFSRQLAIDGNNSLKRFAGPGSQFEAPYVSQYLLGREHTDRFKDEVQQQRRQSGQRQDPRVPGPNDDSAAGIEETECSSRWRNARPENEKTAQWDALDETGVFICACRHGFIVAAVDMWQSGELAKYPLAISHSLLDVLGDEGILQLGYDIGCAHSGTAGRSSFGDRVKALIRFVVGSFHGHAHNRPCQLGFHPRYIEGSGREDFETCERIFSVTNLIAALIRHATPFHRHEDMDRAFTASDAEKYAAIGSLLRAKFKDASDKIDEHRASVQIIKGDPQYTDDFFRKLLADERAYLAGMGTITPPDVREELEHEYLKTLDLWEKARDALAALSRPFVQYRAPGDADTSNRKWVAANRRLREREEQLEALELRLGLDERWTKSTPAYVNAAQYNTRRTYAKALDELERSVVSRLLELEKLNLRSTGYKLRRHIAKALNKRGATLLSALQRYNKAAKSVTPARPTLTREQVLDIAFLADFALLRQDVGAQPWAQPVLRKLTTAWAETARAEEELRRIRVEGVRVRTWIRDEEFELERQISTLRASHDLRDTLLAKELDARAQLLHGVHTGILSDLAALDAADGQTVPRLPGRRIGQPAVFQYPRRDATRVQLPPMIVTRDAHNHAASHDNQDASGDENGDDDERHALEENDEHDLDAFLQTVDRIAR